MEELKAHWRMAFAEEMKMEQEVEGDEYNSEAAIEA